MFLHDSENSLQVIHNYCTTLLILKITFHASSIATHDILINHKSHYLSSKMYELLEIAKF